MFVAIQEVIKTIRCSKCEKYLSLFPIYLTEECLSVCGRCLQDKDIDSIFKRNKPFEEVLSHIMFPCIYDNKGCLEVLTPADVAKHEKICQFRTIKCIDNDCNWMDHPKELLDHVIEKHQHLKLENQTFELDLRNSNSNKFLLTEFDRVFVFERTYCEEDMKLMCTFTNLDSFETSITYTYEIIITDGMKTKEAFFSSSKNNNCIDIDVILLKQRLELPSVMIAKINIIKVALETPKPEDIPTRSSVLEDLECPICFNLMIPPIFQCMTGHSICNECKEEINYCPCCNEEIRNTQNYSLQNIASKVDYTCRFQEHGCKFFARPNVMKKHQQFCEFAQKACPLKDYVECQWKGAKNSLLQHLRKNHEEDMLDVNTVSVFINDEYFNKTDKICYMLQFYDELFLLDYFYENNQFMFSLQFIGPPEKSHNFKYEIEIVDNKHNVNKLLMRRLCCPQTKQESIGQDTEKIICFSREQIEDFIGEELVFRVGMFLNL